MCDTPKVSLQDLIIAAVCFLQEKNWVSVCEIAEFVANKRGCKVEQIEDMIKMILCKAKNKEILCEKKGMYRINERYDDLPQLEEKKNECRKVEISEDDSEDDDEPNPCTCLKLSKDCLDDDDEDEDRCPIKQKKRQCR